MSIRRSPRLTPRSLAARRANALKSTGPRTPCGKARVSLNALKHGRAMGPAGRAPRFRERLLRAGYPYQEALYGDLRSYLAEAFGARTPSRRAEVDRFAASAWCVVMGRHFPLEVSRPPHPEHQAPYPVLQSLVPRPQRHRLLT
jgi:hypothetical protein